MTMIRPAPRPALRVPVLLAAAIAMLAGCARDNDKFPSLAPRPIEKLRFAEPDPTPPAPVEADPVLDATLATIATRLDGVTKGFAVDAAKTEAATRAAKGKAVGSDAWLDAQAALAGLDDWRAQVSSIVTDIDQLASDRAAALAPEYPTMAPLRARGQTEVDHESETILRLQALLPSA
jgi:type IV pilus biogenesis protein CpaD/CtpE